MKNTHRIIEISSPSGLRRIIFPKSGQIIFLQHNEQVVVHTGGTMKGGHEVVRKPWRISNLIPVVAVILVLIATVVWIDFTVWRAAHPQAPAWTYFFS